MARNNPVIDSILLATGYSPALPIYAAKAMGAPSMPQEVQPSCETTAQYQRGNSRRGCSMSTVRVS